MILITGGTGFVGSEYQKLNPNCLLTSRSPIDSVCERFPNVGGAIQWDGQQELDLKSFDGEVHAIVHTLGESIAKGRWTQAKKQRIHDSRVISTTRLVESIAAMEHPPKTLISFSAVGFYGDRGNEALTESSEPGDDFLARVCQKWEAAAQAAEKMGVRVVLLRCPIILGAQGGLQAMLPIFKLCLGGRMGSGKQWMPWIHVSDLCRLINHLIEHKEFSGPINAVAPGIVSNREFTQILARALKRPAFLPAPGFALRLALGQFSTELLASRNIVQDKVGQLDFEFKFETLGIAFEDLLGATSKT